MKVLFTILVTFFAGMGAGLGTGFAGMSAAAVISPMLITFLGMEPYMAVGIALSSDVLASAVFKPCTICHNGKFFCLYDIFAWYQIYCSPGYDNQRDHAGGIRTKACHPVGHKRYLYRIYLWICRCWRRHDDASYPDFCTWV